MVDSVKRRLRDGVAEGEQAPIILVRDSVGSRGGISLLKAVLLGSICDHVSNGLAQAKNVVVVAISDSPESYAKVSLAATRAGSGQAKSWFRVVDCYTDRLGWDKRAGTQSSNDPPESGAGVFSVYRDIRNLDGLQSLVLEAGQQGAHPSQAQDKFVLFVDSISLLLRYHSLHALATFLSALRSHSAASALACLVHSDLHTPLTASALEYLSSTTIVVGRSLELQPKSDLAFKCSYEGSFDSGILHIRQKRRNGRVREQTETFTFEAGELTLGPLQSGPLESRSGKTTVPKVQFNLSLSEKELEDRSKVILPFEHQGNGRERQIYDGRENSKVFNSMSQSQEDTPVQGMDSIESSDSRFGAIHYLRDSDDERPDSDEDPDDDLDI